MNKQFFIKFSRKGKTFYANGAHFEQTGQLKIVAAKKVKKAKKKVVQFSLNENRILSEEKIASGVKKDSKEIADKPYIHEEILSQSIKKSLVLAKEKGKKIGIKIQGKIYQIRKNSLKAFKSLLDLTDKIQKVYFETLKQIGGSPLFFVDYSEARSGIMLDFDKISLGQEDILSEEFPEEAEDFQKEVKKLIKKAFR
jgi:hypothetical protein